MVKQGLGKLTRRGAKAAKKFKTSEVGKRRARRHQEDRLLTRDPNSFSGFVGHEFFDWKESGWAYPTSAFRKWAQESTSGPHDQRQAQLDARVSPSRHQLVKWTEFEHPNMERVRRERPHPKNRAWRSGGYYTPEPDIGSWVQAMMQYRPWLHAGLNEAIRRGHLALYSPPWLAHYSGGMPGGTFPGEWPRNLEGMHDLQNWLRDLGLGYRGPQKPYDWRRPTYRCWKEAAIKFIKENP
jgi:hypothetical protein